MGSIITPDNWQPNSSSSQVEVNAPANNLRRIKLLVETQAKHLLDTQAEMTRSQRLKGKINKLFDMPLVEEYQLLLKQLESHSGRELDSQAAQKLDEYETELTTSTVGYQKLIEFHDWVYHQFDLNY